MLTLGKEWTMTVSVENRIFHCMFEQSGTFKNEFKKLGYEAYDYDIQNEFNETDYQIDLFQEIELAYKRERERLCLTVFQLKI